MIELEEAGVWLWGGATAILGMGIVIVVVAGEPASVYERVRDSATAIGAVVAASALAWSLFYQSGNKALRDERLERIEGKLDEIQEKISAPEQN